MVAHQVPRSLGFSRQEHWSGLPFPSLEDLPNPGIEPGAPTLQTDALLSEPPGKPQLLRSWHLSTHVCTHTHRLQLSLHPFKICLVLLVYLYQQHKNLAINSIIFPSSYVFIFLPSFVFFLFSFLPPSLLPSISSFLPPFFSFFLFSHTHTPSQPCKHTCK